MIILLTNTYIRRAGISSCLVDVFSMGNFIFTMADGSGIIYTNFDATAPTYHNHYRFVTIDASTGQWTTILYETDDIIPVCEVLKGES